MFRLIQITFVITLLGSSLLFAQEESDQENITVYLIPGQGADYRLFNEIDLGPNYILKKLNHCMPTKDMSLEQYAKAIYEQIDSSKPFILIGTSLGGMVAVEMNDFAKPEKTIIISSAKSRHELPARYRFQQYFPLYRIIPAKMSKKGALILQPLVEPDRNKEKQIFESMLNDKEALFFKRSIAMIMEWDRTTYSKDIIHIHGDNDHTIPVRNVDYDHIIEGGSHMITLTKGKEISKLILSILES